MSESRSRGMSAVWGWLLVLAVSLGGLAASAAQEIALADWEFRREGGAWQRVRVPHDWAIAGPFDKEIDKQIVAIVENGEKRAAEKTAARARCRSSVGASTAPR